VQHQSLSAIHEIANRGDVLTHDSKQEDSMNIVSYRGPGMAGGVSSALARVWEDCSDNASWWHLNDTHVQVSRGAGFDTRRLNSFPKELIKGHYDYCNEFLWPVMHDLPQYATYRKEQREAYYRFNEILSKTIGRNPASKSFSYFFVQDYQLAMLPQLLRRLGLPNSAVFWHIPWPKNVREDHLVPIAQIARGLLASEAVGFHVQEYGENFLSFIAEHLPEYEVDFETMTVSPATNVLANVMASHSYGVEPRARGAWKTRATQIVVAPLGLDYDHWNQMAKAASATSWLRPLVKKPYVLSVDRADYTKGVSYRLKAIDAFFTKYPQYRGELTFAQICGRTRPGIAAFDNYWAECKDLATHLKDKWATREWSPLNWIETSFSSEQLSLLYRDAATMLVNPVRDGLNLTAKEYIASQGRRNPGVLALSNEAGAWHELGDNALQIFPEDPEQIADVVAASLNMSENERTTRMNGLIESVRNNPLQLWWERFAVTSGANQKLAEEEASLEAKIS
jgi:trehalose 6-phosphate synthase/phosphatase